MITSRDYKRKKGQEWADEDLKAMLVFLTRQDQAGRQRHC